MSTAAVLQRWRTPADARARLLCFPYAGAGAAIYRRWQPAMSPQVEVLAVRAPGRESRLHESPHRSMAPLVDEVVGALGDGDPRPLLLFGHSLGGSVAFEVAHTLTALGRPPALLAISGRRPPHLPVTRRVAHLDEADLVDHLRGMGGTPDELFEHPELLRLLLPTFRADMEILESYVAESSRPPLDCPVRIYGAADDDLAPPDDLRQWSRWTTSPARVEIFPGGHFYLDGDGGDALRRRVLEAAAAIA